jgi:hypothetical protein
VVQPAARRAPLRQVVLRDHAARGPAARRAPGGQDRQGASHGPRLPRAARGRAERRAQLDLLQSTRVAPRIRGDRPRSRPPRTCS